MCCVSWFECWFCLVCVGFYVWFVLVVWCVCLRMGSLLVCCCWGVVYD